MDYYLLADMTVQIGYELAVAGAETYRVEETMRRVIEAYGTEGQAFAIPNCVAVSFVTPNTKPLTIMKRVGYRPEFSGAVEAVASSGGLIMPPVMGAAAFLMADTLGIPYLEVCKAAVIPAFLYFFSILMMVDFEAAKLGLVGVPKEELPRMKDVVKRLYLLLPIVALLVIMMLGYTPFRAAMAAMRPMTFRLPVKALPNWLIIRATRYAKPH